VQLGANTTITPDTAPTNTTSMNVEASTNFKGRLEGDPTTGVLRLTNAHPAGVFPATVTGFDASGIPSTATFTLTVTTPAACNPVNFPPPANFPVGTFPRSVAVGDFNRDGLQDVATANRDSSNVSILTGNGTGGFGAAVDSTVLNGPLQVAVGDFNGDGIQDLVTANAPSNSVSVLLGNLAGGFNQLILTVPNGPNSVAVGDFNDDDRPDLVVGLLGANSVSVLLNNGTGGFAPPNAFTVASSPVSVAVGDFNGDGLDDIGTANPGTDNVSVLVADAAGGFETPLDLPVGDNPVSIAVGRFNADADQDLVAVNQNSGNVSVLLGNGDGGFSTAINFDVGPGPAEAAVGDFNGDDQQDLAVALSSGGVSILLGNGLGGFGAATVFGAGTERLALAVGDFNGDGMQDLATANGQNNDASVLLRICPPSFAIDSVTQNEGAPGIPTSFVFTVTKTGITTLTTSVEFMTQDGTATLADNDYEFSSGTLTFASDQPTATLTVIVNGDATAEPDETFTVRLSNPVNATVSNAIGTGTITNDDAQPATPTPTPTTTPTPTPTVTPIATPTPTVTPTPSPSATASPSASVPPASPTPTVPPSQAINLSTRMRVGTDDRVAIGGLIVTGSAPKRLLFRGIGPSLSRVGIADFLADPVLELHGSCVFPTMINNNWRDTQEQEIEATGIPPTNDFESAIIATLDPGFYTVILRGSGNSTGVALLEIYDLNQAAASKLANISTRAFVSTGSDIVIAGFLLGNGSGDDSLIVRGLGPSLSAAGLAPVLADPTLELRDDNGTLLISNDNWEDNPAQAAEIIAAGLAPGNNLESAIAATLPPGAYTALLAGLNNSTGLGLVEVYNRGDGSGEPPPPPPPACTPTPTPPSSPTPIPTPTPTPAPPGPCVENFDGVIAPDLPAGWVATNAVGPDPLWITSPTTPDTAPNDAVVKDSPEISDKRLDSRSIVITSAQAQLSFRNNFNLQDTFDGGVLEVSAPNIAGGAFTDITSQAVGGSFVTGGYTDTISLAFGSPIAGRMAWSGNSGGYINSVVNLGPNVNGQTIKLRFRLGTDAATGSSGWRIDTISITGGACP
jgi:outer membrane biosynthesis protein TonB